MRKFLSLIVTTIFISACTSNTPQPNPISDSDQVATIVAATLAAHTSTEISATPTPPTDSFSINGQLQGTLAFIRDNNLWISVNGVENQITNDADPSNTGLPRLWYSNPQISPDGTKIAYLKNSGTDVRTLMVYDINGKNMMQLANDAAWIPPATEWSNDNQKIYYPISNGFDTTSGLETIVVKSINLTTGELQEYGQYGVQTGCGGGSSDPADRISSDENILTSTGGGYIFDLSPQNNYLIHATICHNIGLRVFDLSTQQDRTLDDNVEGSVISPDGLRTAAISNNNIVIFNVNTGSIENTFLTSEAPRALLWGANGKEILYSTSRLGNTVMLEDNVALDLFSRGSMSFKLNISALWMISLESGQSNKILQVEAHDLKPIVINGQKAIVVVVQNANKLFDYINQGNRENLAEYYPTTNLIEVDLVNLSSNLVTNNTQQASFFK